MSDTGTTQSGVVASVGGQDIHAQDVTRATQAQMAHGAVSRAIDAIHRGAANGAVSLIQQAEVRYEARRMGFKVSDAEIRDELQNGQYKEMFFPGGNWIGQQKYEDLLRENEISPDD